MYGCAMIGYTLSADPITDTAPPVGLSRKCSPRQKYVNATAVQLSRKRLEYRLVLVSASASELTTLPLPTDMLKRKPCPVSFTWSQPALSCAITDEVFSGSEPGCGT